jgi:DNA mismatch repair protein MutL
MGKIRLLSDTLASQVAAGEVVERPASVLKELVENSIDAGASRIDVNVRRGGISSITITDDGHGMDRDDALLALERHATSKLRTPEDLSAIGTLGFRGEALPSIASVSRFHLSTREHGAVAGTDILVNGGRIESVRDAGVAPGTRIEVRSLFFNIPARRKFLRTENTEAAHLETQLQLLAIGHPGVTFTYTKDERQQFHLAATSDLLTRIRDLAGREVAGRLVEIRERTLRGIQFRGFLGKAGVSRSDRSQQIVYVNGRTVDAREVNFALREGYHTALMRGQYPITYLFIDLDPALVDVNVHPAKREVRFRDPRNVRDAVVQVVRDVLEDNRSDWSRQFEAAQSGAIPSAPQISTEPQSLAQQQGTPSEIPAFAPERALPSRGFVPPPAPPSPAQASLIPEREQVTLRSDWSEFPQPPQVDPRGAGSFTQGASSPPPPAGSPFTILGVLGKLYVLMEGRDGLVLVDQHAAHERILFEEMRRRLEDQSVVSQRLLLPLTIQVSPKDEDWLRGNLKSLHRMGIGIEEFGPGTFKIDSLPPFLNRDEPMELIKRIIDDLRTVSSSTSSLRLGEDVIAKTVCRHAVKANDTLRGREIDQLIRDLLACELPYCCPHGRPTMIQLSYPELERKFGRAV